MLLRLAFLVPISPSPLTLSGIPVQLTHVAVDFPALEEAMHGDITWDAHLRLFVPTRREQAAAWYLVDTKRWKPS